MENPNESASEGQNGEPEDLTDWEEFGGEGYIPNYVCMKRELPGEDVCASEISSCTEIRTTSGNILDRIIVDPQNRRRPCLGKWPVELPKSVSDLQENVHQHKAALQPTTIAQMCSLRITSKPNPFRQPAIVATLGPASADLDTLIQLFEVGVNIVRLSMSHTDPCSVPESFGNVIEASNRFRTIKDYEIPIAIMMHLKGPDIRIGRIDYAHASVRNRDVYLKEKASVILTVNKEYANRCSDKIIYVDYEELPKQVSTGMRIYLANGEIKLRVALVEKTKVTCTVDRGGRLLDNQRIYIPEVPKLRPPLSDYDVECLQLAINSDVDIISIPLTRNDAVVLCVRDMLASTKRDNDIKIFACISNYEGLENIDEILRVADGIILDRKALSLEIGPEKMFIAQKEIIAKSIRLGKPILCTAQLQVTDKISQRMEMNDIGALIVDGADGIILISETALGDKGAKSVCKLSAIMREAEAATMQKPFYFDLVNEQIPALEPSKAIALASVQIANKIQASAILTVTTSGKTAQMLSWFRPRCPVIAITRVGSTARQLHLWRAVLPLHFSAPLLPDWFHDLKARFEYGIGYGKSQGIIESGDMLVLVSGFRKGAGFTNSIRIVFASVDKDNFADYLPVYYQAPKESYSSAGIA